MDRRFKQPYRPCIHLAAFLVGLATIMPGCSSDQPTISGFGLGSSRTVSVGDTFEIRIPVAENGVRLWRITSYDSTFVTISDNPRTAPVAEGHLVIPIQARQPGETEIEVTQRIPAEAVLAGAVPRSKRFRIHIVR